MRTIFWQDYFDFLGETIKRLGEVIRHPELEKNDYMQDATIQRFEFVIELFWKVLKKILAYEKVDANTPREVLSQAFQFGLIDDESMWLKMLDDRNNTSHVYKREDAERVFRNTKNYLPTLEETYAKLKKHYNL